MSPAHREQLPETGRFWVHRLQRARGSRERAFDVRDRKRGTVGRDDRDRLTELEISVAMRPRDHGDRIAALERSVPDPESAKHCAPRRQLDLPAPRLAAVCDLLDDERRVRAHEPELDHRAANFDGSVCVE